MSTAKVTFAAVAALFTAANRNATKAELDLYHAALAEETDDDVREAVVLIVRGVDLGERPPSPALVIETIRGIQRRRHLENPQTAIPEHTGPLIPGPDLAARARAEIANLANAKRLDTRRRAAQPVYVDGPEGRKHCLCDKPWSSCDPSCFAAKVESNREEISHG